MRNTGSIDLRFFFSNIVSASTGLTYRACARAMQDDGTIRLASMVGLALYASLSSTAATRGLSTGARAGIAVFFALASLVVFNKGAGPLRSYADPAPSTSPSP